ncbi:ribosome small subunit-dependent GTPase A [Negativibacillus massiliensis]|uniref:ribosome small subunit-dependent GTPase A n=1 Tax=Negativibacillus massiliensis TaxID=1871035 RepID=UPI003AF28BA1
MTKQNVRGRIIKSLGGFYYVADSEQKENIIECRARGAFRQQNVKPCVGDWAQVELTPQGKGYVVEIEERKNSLVRPPLANLDQLVLVVSIADPAPNAFVLDKLIAIAEYQEIEPIIVITKCDLADPEEFAQIYRKAGFTVLETKSLQHEGIESVMEILKDKTSAFCGNSGAGKSTLLNAIDPRLSLDTGDISQKLGRGRHTTRHVELYELPSGGFVADTPGFSAVDLEKFQIILKDELAGCFREMRQYEGKCRFRGCSHTKEAGCAVLEAVKNGEISQSRHQSYLNLYELAKNIKEWEIGR